MRFLARVWFRLKGWRYEGSQPTARKYVAIGAPHTSNWDFVMFLAVTSHFGMKAEVMGKHTLVKPPFGAFMRALGVIPVRRDTGQGAVEQMVDAFAAAGDMVLVIAPEGTRRAATHWRSGFYRIAVAAGVPIIIAKLDSVNKVATLSDELMLTGNVTSDMDRVRAFLSDAAGLKPAGESTIRLREEDDTPAAD